MVTLAPKRTTTDSPDEAPAYLVVPRDAFAHELEERLSEGRALLARDITTHEALKAAKSDYYTWDEFNRDWLRRRFTTGQIAEEYSGFQGGFYISDQTLAEEIEDFREDVGAKVRRLESIKSRLPLFEETAQARAADEVKPRRREISAPETIFIVHGRDERAELAVHGLVRQVTDVEPVVLHAQPNTGRTIIEKFEAVASAAGLAIVLLTPDDIGGLNADQPELRPRARQNVVFEFGFFVGVLGRSRVVVLHTGDLELPSDLHGLVYIPFDEAGAWKVAVARELKAAGFSVHADKLL
jgi:predicted nucleotide-binding protein